MGEEVKRNYGFSSSMEDGISLDEKKRGRPLLVGEDVKSS